MSAFAMAQESADNMGYENNAPLANGEETQTVANEIAEVQGLAQEAADADTAADKLEDEAGKTEELAESLEADVAQENILDPTAAKFLALSFKNIVGAKYAKSKLPAQESWAGTRAQAKENTRLALEGIKETLKAFWEAIKAQFKKVYTSVKSWVIKTFSAAKKLKARAETLQKRASDTVGSIEEKTFSFSQTKAIAVEGKYNDAGVVLSGVETLSKVIVGTIEELKKDKVDDAIETTVGALKSAFSGSGKTRTLEASKVSALATAVKGGVKGASLTSVPSSVGDVKKYAEQFGDAAEVEITGVFGLPGSKAIIQAVPKGSPSDIEAAVKHLKGGRLIIASDKYTSRDIAEGDVKTLTTSQVDKACDSVINIAEAVYEFEKSWAQNDKFVEKVQKEVDDIVKEFEGEDDADAKDQRHFRNFCNASIGAIRRHSNFKVGLCSYGVTTGNAVLNYAERSLAQHKAK